jgi:TRAP-type C4-dicarboxylate transport system substrate-binding protein
MKIVLALLLLLVLFLAGPAAALAQAPLQLKAGSGVGPGNPVNDALYDLARTLDARSGGRIKLDVVISNGLAKGEAAHLEGAQLGTIDIVPIGSAPIGGMFETAYQALDLPFFWASREQVWKVMDGPIGQDLLKRMESKGVKGFCFGGGWGFRNMMVNKRAISTPRTCAGSPAGCRSRPPTWRS